MATEVWFRNPLTYIRECAELLAPNIAWDRGLLRKRRVDGQRYVELNYPDVVEYRILLVGDQGSAELRRGYSMSSPYAVYPTWEYGMQGWAELEHMLANPAGADPDRCKRRYGTLPDEVPVLGQEHRVVVIRWPNAGSPEGKAFLARLAEYQAAYPDAIVHLHGGYSFRYLFGSGFGAADIEPRSEAANGIILLGSGRKVKWENAPNFIQWVHLNGFKLSELSVPRNRCLFNMKSAIWAGEHYNENVNFRSRAYIEKRDSPDDPEYAPKPTKRNRLKGAAPKQGDMISCDTCSLDKTCKYFRDGGVCSIPESDMASLARFFNTRDSDRIIEGLGKLLSIQAERAESGMAAENLEGELDPEVTRIINGIFANGVKLAKLVNPALAAASAPKIGVQINTAAAVAAARPNALMAAAVAELESRGIPRDEITAEMVAAVVEGRPLAIEATVHE